MSMKENLSNFAKNAKTTMIKYGPGISTGLGVGFLFIAIGTAVYATPKALEKIDEAKKEKVDNQVQEGVEEDEIVEDLTVMETVKATWKCYIPTVTSAVIGTTCILGASSKNTKRNAALATAYKLSETALSEYKDAVVETIGEKKEEAVREKMAERRLEKNPVKESDIIITGNGTTLCYESLSGRYFKSDMNKIQQAEIQLGYAMRDEGYVSLNALYGELGLEHTDIGYKLGWNLDRDGVLKFYYDSKLASDGTPCLVLDFNEMPKYDFDMWNPR